VDGVAEEDIIVVEEDTTAVEEDDIAAGDDDAVVENVVGYRVTVDAVTFAAIVADSEQSSST